MPSSVFVYIFSYIFHSYLASQGFILDPHWGTVSWTICTCPGGTYLQALMLKPDKYWNYCLA